MGMFYYLTCEYPLPDPEAQRLRFQTKSLECLLDRYTITADGRLILHQVRYEAVPEAERPCWGTPDWEKPFRKLLGSLRAVQVGNRDTQYHGDIRFYEHVERQDGGREWFEFAARFTDGQLQWIRRVDDPGRNPRGVRVFRDD